LVDKADKIEKILQNLRGNYDLLESHYGYVQWLFRNRVLGVNLHAPKITDEDTKFIEQSSEIRIRFLSCFDFYGFER
jgi:hypothetical protein